ncbi:hypothetical protein HY504_02010 [Candidatus Wolfebacteria bacterium]|nr:hypothetical protein [Candidatus Wolfebacteria bacterium]
MTIVQPYKRTPLGILFFWIMGFVISGIALYGIILYNQLVDIRHDVSAIHQNVRRAEVMNAELKNTLYAATDPINPEGILRDRGFIVDGRPTYARSEPRVDQYRLYYGR